MHMLAKRAVLLKSTLCRRHSVVQVPKAVPALPDNGLELFRAAFNVGSPVLLSRGSFNTIPAIRKWFQQSFNGKITLNQSYLRSFESTIVPLEFSTEDQFSRTEQRLSVFLDASAVNTPMARVYLAQAPISNLPQDLRDDVPTPDLVLNAGKGDVYDSSIWLGQAPTYTPLHRDPNPNLFVQLAGTKVVRMFRPELGRAIFANVQARIGGSASATLRGEEMMHGAEKDALESEVWHDTEGSEFQDAALQAELNSGDGLFIPKGWWHSVKSVGQGMNGSVNWWFR